MPRRCELGLDLSGYRLKGWLCIRYDDSRGLQRLGARCPDEEHPHQEYHERKTTNHAENGQLVRVEQALCKAVVGALGRDFQIASRELLGFVVVARGSV